ncbi:hypothetical protein F0267_00025 [Vibrio coralliilyticus]|uniref:Uncharacterized protein n=1 Tax=Vibrio coralliilyticus TaxID=190893 RepID=A0AAN0W0Z8_9VIBR|nr:hypothetical protein [Vibrio coralliilyticus]AIW22508.1 hypothetical protein IX92_25935 [Vibrio coralliilyticus]NOH36604.1 hypothetical protein [Vibrio coralliilyticus]
MAKSIRTRRFIHQCLQTSFGNNRKVSWISLCLRPLHTKVSVYGNATGMTETIAQVKKLIQAEGIEVCIRRPSLDLEY